MQREDAIGEFIGRIAADFAAALDTEGLATAGEEESQVIVDFGGGGDRGARVTGGIFLADSDGRSDAGDFVDFRLFHALKELARVGGEGFDVAALAFRVDSVERERGFAGTADAGDDCKGVVRDVYRDVFEVVHAGAADTQNFLLFQNGGDGFVRCQREAQTARFPRGA